MANDSLCAIVTGSASGLGAATAEILARSGARLVINYSSSQKEAEATAEVCRKAGAAEVLVAQGDVSRDEDCRKIVAAAAPWGRLDMLVNNAGTTKHVAHADLDGLSAEDFQRLYGVNTIGPFQMVRAARSLLEAGAKASGRPSAVVNVSSVAGAKQVRDSVVAKVPLKVASTADDIAQLVCFLAMPASSNMTGEVVRMDAGMHLIA